MVHILLLLKLADKLHIIAVLTKFNFTTFQSGQTTVAILTSSVMDKSVKSTTLQQIKIFQMNYHGWKWSLYQDLDVMPIALNTYYSLQCFIKQ